jgi:hypothetical protein
VTETALLLIRNCFVASAFGHEAATLGFGWHGTDTAVEIVFSTSEGTIHEQSTASGPGEDQGKSSSSCTTLSQTPTSVGFSCDGEVISFATLPASLRGQAGPPPT